MAKKRGFDVLRFIKILASIVGFLISFMFLIFVGFILLSFLSLFFAEPDLGIMGNVAQIHVKGTISTTGGQDFYSTGGTKSGSVVKWIKEAEENDQIKAILFEIDSPGGTPVGSYEIVEAIQRAEKPTVAVIHEMGNSGAYWIASAADTIFANRLSTVGSIGVRASYLDFAGLMTDYNVTYNRLVSGKFKDTMSPFKEMTPEEKTLIQSRLDKLHEIFINDVAKNRGMDAGHVRDIATGYVYFGQEAVELGLIDYVGTTEDAKKYLEKKLNISVEFKKFKEKKGLFDIFTSVMHDASYNVGQGIGSVWLSSTEDDNLELLV
jgi:protease-4